MDLEVRYDKGYRVGYICACFETQYVERLYIRLFSNMGSKLLNIIKNRKL